MRALHRIHTSRLTLVKPVASDADAIFSRYASDVAVTRYLGWPRHRSVEDTRAFLAWSDEHWSNHSAGPYLIHTREDGRLIGSTGLTFDDEGGAMTGYVLAHDAWGQGFATESLQAMVDLARTSEIPRLYAFCHPDHRASQRVLEKCGFLRDESWESRMQFPNLELRDPQDTLYYVRWP